MLLVVFGAGSSYDSYPQVPASAPPTVQLSARTAEDRPPLANQLFDNRGIFLLLMEKFKDCQAVVPMLRQSGASVEKKLAELREQGKTFPLARRELAAIQYYLHFALWDCQEQWYNRHRGITNFATLLREIERWRFETNEYVCFVTFNYDTMLESAMETVLRLTAQSMDSYRDWKNYSLFKLHGSVDWGRVVEHSWGAQTADFFYRPLIDSVERGVASITERYELCTRDMSPKPPVAGMVLYPALSIPVEKKDEFSCPAEHVAALEALLPRVTKVITIGWRATEAEFLAKLKFARQQPYAGIRHAMDLLIVTVGSEGAGETLGNLINVAGATPELFPNHTRDAVVSGFTGLINNLGALNNFLRRGPQ